MGERWHGLEALFGSLSASTVLELVTDNGAYLTVLGGGGLPMVDRPSTSPIDSLKIIVKIWEHVM